MNVARTKALLWLVSLAVAGYLGFFVYRFLQERESISPVSEAHQKEVLEAVERPEPPKENVVAYAAVKGVFHDMNWTGKAPAPVDTGEETKEPEEKPRIAVADLLAVLLIQVDTDSPESCLAVVEYENGQLKAAAKTREDYVLRPGETLPGPFSNVKVASIEVAGVRFVFTDDEGREAEVVPPLPLPSSAAQIVLVGPEGVLVPERAPSTIQRREHYPEFRPRETQEVRKNEYQVGIDTAARISQDYSRILSQDVGYQPYRNPRTRQVEGLQVSYVRPGSVVAEHGIQEGEILKSINGHPVKSTSDAIAYVKKVANETDVWVAVFERFGKEFTRTYKSPPPE